jgi:hypothetical protein
MAQYNFGSGAVWSTPLTDAFGAVIANPTPLLIGVLQDASIDISSDTKMLYGQNQYPVAVGRGKGKVSGKMKFGQINGAIFNSVFFGQTMTSSLIASVADVTGAVIPATPFTITPTVPGAGTWQRDLGVRDANGNPMTLVASGPTTGQYTVTAGAYLFAAADTGKLVFISYKYTGTSTTAKTSLVKNIAMGSAPTFKCDFFNQLGGNGLDLTLYSCVANKLSFATKQDDFLIPEIDFDAFADAAGNVVGWGTAQ